MRAYILKYSLHVLGNHIIPPICVPADHYLAGKRFIHFSDITEELSVLDPASRSGQHQSREFQKLLQEKQVPVSYISTVNESTRDYTLKYSSYCSFSSLMDLIFHSIENRYYCFLDEPETVSSIYISYLKEKATELSPFTDWFQKRPEILGRFIEELLA